MLGVASEMMAVLDRGGVPRTRRRPSRSLRECLQGAGAGERAARLGRNLKVRRATPLRSPLAHTYPRARRHSRRSV